VAGAGALPELARVPWRRRVDDRVLRRWGRRWTISIFAQTIPFLAVATLLVVSKPILFGIGIVALAYAWILPELYAARGAGVLRPRPGADAQAEAVSLGLLGDLLDHRARELLRRSGLAMERGELGVWLVGQAGALLVRPGGRRVYCYCVRVPDPELPSGDRIAHLLLALRTDEAGFATVANVAFSGARWRLRRRLGRPAREALAAAGHEARLMPRPSPGPHRP
jgi:hypothetical protein